MSTRTRALRPKISQSQNKSPDRAYSDNLQLPSRLRQQCIEINRSPFRIAECEGKIGILLIYGQQALNPWNETGSALVVTNTILHYLTKYVQIQYRRPLSAGAPLGAGISPLFAKGATPKLDDCRNSAACRKLQLKEEIQSSCQMAKHLSKKENSGAQVEPVLRETGMSIGMARRSQARDNDHRKGPARIWRLAESLSDAE